MLDDTFIYENIIPINFMGGTGGTFLCNFLQSAKFNIKKLYMFNKFGSCHIYENKFPRELEIALHKHTLETPLDQKILHIKNSDLSHKLNVFPPFFTTIHAGNLSEVKNYFNKIIHIFYEENDSVVIALIFLCKKYIESNSHSIQHIKTNLLYRAIPNFKLNSKTFCYDNVNNVCNISWKDLFVNDPNNLIQKLADFTNIPNENFYVDNLLMWRDKTKQGVYNAFNVKI